MYVSGPGTKGLSWKITAIETIARMITMRSIVNNIIYSLFSFYYFSFILGGLAGLISKTRPVIM